MSALEWLHITKRRSSSYEPAGYLVHRRGVAAVYRRTLTEAKAWVAAEYGPFRWERREVPDGRSTRVEWWPR